VWGSGAGAGSGGGGPGSARDEQLGSLHETGQVRAAAADACTLSDWLHPGVPAALRSP
jgi:hypothetical protein